jgi:hypothetical protein
MSPRDLCPRCESLVGDLGLCRLCRPCPHLCAAASCSCVSARHERRLGVDEPSGAVRPTVQLHHWNGHTGGPLAASYFDLKKSAWHHRMVDLVREDGLDPLG